MVSWWGVFFYSLSIPINVHFNITQANNQCYLTWHVITLPFKDLPLHLSMHFQEVGSQELLAICNCLKGDVFEVLQLLKSTYQVGHIGAGEQAQKHALTMFETFGVPDNVLQKGKVHEMMK